MILLSILNPANKNEAGITLFLILLGAAIIGFIVAWLIFRARSAAMHKEITSLQLDLKHKNENLKKLDNHSINLQAENNRLHEQLNKLMEKAPVADETGPFMEVMDHHKANAEKLGFKLNESGRKDDLKKIHGVGPFIESKLNALGIYTFEQISEFNMDTVNKVTEAIEFFPGRIERDHWVEQANELKHE